MRKITDYLTMWFAWTFFWLVTAIMFISLIVLCVAVPAALVLGFWQLFKMF